jgi:hypothetical protein
LLDGRCRAANTRVQGAVTNRGQVTRSQGLTLRTPDAGTELCVEEGETVAVLLMESSWGWATNESGDSGWVPLECLA